MIAIAVLTFVIAALIGIAVIVGAQLVMHQWRMLKRKSKALRMGAPRVMIWPNSYQPLALDKAVYDPLPFYPETVCPHCGFYDSHTMAQPMPVRDHPLAITVRRCKDCNHVWGEK